MKILLISILTLLILASCQTPTKSHSGFIQPPGISGEHGADQACTQEAKSCPDGNSVGRVGPNCEFAPCPELLPSERVVLNTQDGAVVIGTLYPAPTTKAILLLHMLGKTRQSWEEFGQILQGAGYTALAIDLRGHGESILKNNKHIQFPAFSDQDYNDMTYDVGAAVNYLKNKTVYLVGASIGANLALKYAAHDSAIQKIILLSPGLEYHGVNVEQDNLMYTGQVLFVASEDDAYSTESSKKLAGKSRGNAKLQLYETAGHGTSMFTAQPELAGFLIDWLNGS